MTCIRISSLALILGLATAAQPTLAAELKMATLAPRNSTWNKIFEKVAEEVKTGTAGAVTMKIYPGGTQGDEKRVVEKMRNGQLDIGAITAVGLSEVAPEVLVLQSGAIRTYKKLDAARAKHKDRFEKSFSDKGFVLLGWGDVGQVYYYANEPVANPSDTKKTKMWVWNADPIAREMASILGLTPVPLSVPDVLPSLNTGHINAFYTSPLACLQLQWCNHAKFRTVMPLAVGVGAIIISKKALDALPPEQQTVVKNAWAKWSDALTKQVRSSNESAVKVGKDKMGIQDVDLSKEQIIEWDTVSKKVQQALVGKVYPQALLDDVRNIN
jgi:TRAP-type C4-dicarboxylate transport system substrate-binding protein